MPLRIADLQRDAQPRRLGAGAADAGVLLRARHGAEVRGAAGRTLQSRAVWRCRRPRRPGGLLLPAAIYLALNRDDPSGWAIGCATDGAAALTAFSLAGPRLAHSLRVLLMSVAIVGNLAATVLTAILDDSALRDSMLIGAAVVLALLTLLARWRRAPFLFYAAGFTLVWGFVLKSGLDTALAGVACAFVVPIGTRRLGQDSMVRYFMESLHGYVAFAVRPLFVFTVVGVAYRDLRLADLGQAAPLGVMLALAVGKPLGVFTACAAAIGLKLARRPTGAKWIEILGVALLCGAGGTVSYYVAGMGGTASAAVRTAILIASTATALAGGWLLATAQLSGVRRTSPPPP